MSENTVVITEKDGKYHLQNNGIPQLALIGILECIVFEMKTAGRRELSGAAEPAASQKQETVKKVEPERTAPKENEPKSNASELRTRIGNAVKAIKDLGGEASDSDASAATDEELQEKLTELTEQYKRLKSSKGAKK